MKKNIILPIILMLALCGCKSLDPTGAYKSDKVLYDADLALLSSYEGIHAFVTFEYNNRTTLKNPDMTAFADNLRRNFPKWWTSALALRDAYKGAPNAGTQTALQKIIATMREAAVQATAYMVAPPPPSMFSTLTNAIPTIPVQ